MTRREVLLYLLEHHSELTDPLYASSGPGEGAIPLLPHDKGCRIHSEARCTCWRRSLTELDRALTELRATRPVHAAHLTARYRHATRHRREVQLRNGAWVTEPNERVVIPDFDPRSRGPKNGLYDTLVVRWPAWVDLLIVVQAVDRLELVYRGEPYLPREAVAA